MHWRLNLFHRKVPEYCRHLIYLYMCSRAHMHYRISNAGKIIIRGGIMWKDAAAIFHRLVTYVTVPLCIQTKYQLSNEAIYIWAIKWDRKNYSKSVVDRKKGLEKKYIGKHFYCYFMMFMNRILCDQNLFLCFP